MSTENSPNLPTRPSLLRNWLSLTGLVICIGGVFSFFLLSLLDVMSHSANPYIGILTYFVVPGFLIFGLMLTAIGALRERQKLRQFSGGLLPKVVVDLSRPRDRRIMGAFILATVVFLLISALGSYQTYHFTESVQFCGQACHTVMKPELVTYQQGPHARVGCVECHIGAGAKWYVKSKLSGTYQLYAVAFNKYPRPVPTPIRNLRPAQETCEQCHWPQKFVGNLERQYSYFLSDETNTPFNVRMLLKVGGGDASHGPLEGIHWHMNVGNKIEYFASDEARQKIPWVRMTDSYGVVVEFRSPNFTNSVNEAEMRRMDCMDCHNRPAHRYQTPDAAVNLALSLNQIDRSLPYIKTNAVYALTRSYTNETRALEGIATILAERYPADKFPLPQVQKSVREAITRVQRIYQANFFPEMKASWEDYPENIGHKDWPGCFRCHDGKHKTADGKRMIKANNCEACHTILAQGTGAEFEKMQLGGQKFKHPADEVQGDCHDCHSGTIGL